MKRRLALALAIIGIMLSVFIFAGNFEPHSATVRAHAVAIASLVVSAILLGYIYWDRNASRDA